MHIKQTNGLAMGHIDAYLLYHPHYTRSPGVFCESENTENACAVNL